MDLTNPSALTQLLKKHQLHTQKQFGQNFLINPTVINDSLNAAILQADDIVIEIGAGVGTLTQELAKRARRVIVFEIDQSLKPALDDTLNQLSNIELHFQDFRKVNISEIISDSASTTEKSNDYKVVANLPYNAGTHILGQLLQLSQPPQSITVLLQREVAEKITAQPPHATYLSNFVQLYGVANIVRVVNPGSFLPPPKVHSAVLHIMRHQHSYTQDVAAFSRFLHRGFANPRKKINKAFPSDQLHQADIDPNARPENLTFTQWLKLFEITKREIKR